MNLEKKRQAEPIMPVWHWLYFFMIQIKNKNKNRKQEHYLSVPVMILGCGCFSKEDSAPVAGTECEVSGMHRIMEGSFSNGWHVSEERVDMALIFAI